MAEFDVDVVIIGAGWTGVSAAQEIERSAPSLKCVVLEGSDRVGGRTYRFEYDPSGRGRPLYWEHGAQYIGQAQSELWNLVKDRSDLVDGYAARLAWRDQVMVINQRRSCYDRDECLFNIGGLPPDLGLFDTLSTMLMIGVIQSIEQAVDVIEPWKSHPDLVALDAKTMEEWLTTDCDWLTPTAMGLVRVAVNAVLSVEARNISPLYFFWYSACNDGFLQECNDEEGGPQQYFLGDGVQAVVEEQTATLSSPPQYNRDVVKVAWDDAKPDSPVTVSTADGDIFHARHVVVATSLHTASHIEFEPALSGGQQTLVAQPMGRTIKCMVYYKSAWWRDSHGRRYTGYSGADEYPVTWVMDYSPTSVDDVFCLMTFTTGDFTEGLDTKEKIVALVTDALAFLFDDTRALASGAEFIDLAYYAWTETAPFAFGGPNTVLGANVLNGAPPLNTPLSERVWFACAENSLNPAATATSRYYDPASKRYSDLRFSMGYMDGAIRSGKYVAATVLAAAGHGPPPPAPPAPASSPPQPDLPGTLVTVSAKKVLAILEAFRGALMALVALDTHAPPTVDQLTTQIGIAFGGSLLAGLLLPNLTNMVSVIKSGYAYQTSTATDATTTELRRQVRIIEGLFLSLTATVQPASGAPGRLRGAENFLVGVRTHVDTLADEV